MARKRRKNTSVNTNSNVENPITTSQSNDVLAINKEFADRYAASKRRQLLSNGSAALHQYSDDSSSSSEEEDELGELLTKGIDKQFRDTLEAIRSKDPRIYDKNTTFFNAQSEDEEDDDDSQLSYDSDDEPVAGWDSIAEAAKRDARKLTLKDYVRENLLKDGRLSDSDIDGESEAAVDQQGEGSTAHEDAAEKGPRKDRQAKSGSPTASNLLEDESEEEEDFFTKKDKTTAEIEQEEEEFDKFLKKQSIKRAQQTGEELLLHSYLENETPDEKERFLRDFVLNNGWLDKNAADAPGANDYKIEVDLPNQEVNEIEEDESFDEKNDEFEAKYNFRFEDPEGSNVVSYARNIPDSIRRPDERRKKAREARRLRKQQEKAAKIEDIKRLKNLKKKEIQARLVAIQEAAGDELDITGFDLDGDFDPDEFNKQMESKFGDEYYSREDKHMKKHEERRNSGLPEKDTVTERSNVPEDMQDDVSRMIDEYYNLNYEDIVGGVPVRFKYKKVVPESFNMTAEEILTKEDKELNSIVSLKYLAPYRSEREVKKKAWRAASILKKKRNSHKGENTVEQANGIAPAGDNEGKQRGEFSKTEKRKRGRPNEEVDVKQIEEADGWDDVVVDALPSIGESEREVDNPNGTSKSKPKRKRRKKRTGSAVAA
ncbi:KRR1 interacting protein [Gracilaria domingensis]|nr:KRR1 interacting protein [Gracilaria domingensis]